MLTLFPFIQPASAQVRWRTGTSALSGKTRAEVVEIIANPGPRQGGRHIVLQFDEPMTSARRAELQAVGVTLLSYLGDNAFFATTAPGGADRVALAANPHLLDAKQIQPRWKLHPVLDRGETPSWAVVPVPGNKLTDAGASDKVWFAAYLMYHGDVPRAEATRIVEAHGAVVRTQLLTIDGMVIEMPLGEVAALSAEDAVMYLEPALPQMAEVNNSNRVITEADLVQAAPYNLDGSGVTVMVYDGGYARASHVDFQGRLTARDNSGLSSHATHVSGTIGGAGVANATYKGMAPGVTIQSYGFQQVGGLQPGFLYTDPGDMEADYGEAINVYGADISNNSIGTNTAPNGFPCAWTGDYGVTSTVIDSIVRGSLSGGTPFRIVWANGNERQTTRCGNTYQTTAPPACAKNHITVGALNSNDDSVTFFTSWGPADDGRLKPDISAPGCETGGDSGVTSCSGGSDTGYTTFCGTSMASPTVCGLSALLLQDFRAQFPGQPDFRNSTLKALLAHNAQDIEAIGPDYKTGYGSVRIKQTIDFMRTGAFVEQSVSQGISFIRAVAVNPGDPGLKVTLAWDDPPGTPNVDPALVNDLDLRVISPTGVRHYPWTLGGVANPAAPAVQTVEDHINNIEQVFVSNPEIGTWTIEVLGFNVPQGPQVFSLVGDGASNDGTIISFPNGLPTVISPAAPAVVDVRIVSIGESLVPGSPTYFYRYTGGAYISSPLTSLGGEFYQATLPAPLCGDTPEFYFSAEGTVSGVVLQPSGAPAVSFNAIAGDAVILFTDDFENDQGWVAENLGATSGDWQRGVPVNDPAWAYDPTSDSDGSGRCYLTQNIAGNSDVDNGAVRLTSPAIDMTGGNITIGYDYYLYLTDTAGGVDLLLVEIDSNGGAGPWIEIARHDTNGGLTWRHNDIDQATLDSAGVVLTPTMKLRFTTNDATPQSVNESGLDAVQVASFQCGTIVGACCVVDGSCTVRAQANCVAFGEVYQGDNTRCDPNPCPAPTGACCFTDGSCLVQTSNDCLVAGGLYQGNNTTCVPNLCPQPGACCFDDGSCLILAGNDCLVAGGVYQGNDTTCLPNLCPQPGACCFADGSCMILSSNGCLAAGGSFQGGDTDCTPNPCPQPTGACCDIHGVCTSQTSAACAAAGGTYLGDGFSCFPNPCPVPRGACCDFEGSCGVETEADCLAVGSTYQGDGTVCLPNPCPQLTGACCQLDASCFIETELACRATGGEYIGDGAPCTPLPCQLPEDGCCFADGTCQDMTEAACVAAGGAPQGFGVRCDSNPCTPPPSACCFADGTCQDVADQAACDALGGTFGGAGKDCAATTCSVLPGACCYLDATCTDEPDAAACVALGGVYQGNGTACLTTMCPLYGDVDCDGVLDMNDAQTMVDVLLATDTVACHISAADLNGDGVADGDDIQLFVVTLVGP